MITAPAAFSRSTRTASSVGRQSLKAGMPQVVGRPATLYDSFTVIGRPSNGRRSPRASAWSAAIAAWRARSKSRTTTAIDRFVERLDARDRLVEQFDRRDSAVGKVGHLLAGVRYHLPAPGRGWRWPWLSWPNAYVEGTAHAAVDPP
jgi:hypothetical protein